MIRLKKLILNHIRCFTEEQSVDFSSFGKLVQVDGHNQNTGGSSGAGKTTIFLALDYLLDTGSVPATVLQSRLTKEPMSVEGLFVIDGEEVTISRSKKNGLIIKTPKETVSGNVKLAEEKLDELIGIPRDVFKKMIHKRQKEGGFFLEMTAKKTYEFLIHVLGLDVYIEKSDKITEDIKQCTENLSKFKSNIEASESYIKELKDMLEAKEKPTCSVSQEEVEKLDTEIKQKEYYLKKIQQDLQSDKEKIQRPEKLEVKLDNSKLKEVRNELSEANTKLNKMKEAYRNFENHLNGVENMKQEAKRYGNDISELKKQKEHISKSQCPTCKQKWVGDSAQEKIENIDSKINDLMQSALKLKEGIAKESEYKANVERLSKIIEDTEKQIEHLRQRENEENIKLGNQEKDIENKNLKLENEYKEKLQNLEDTYTSEINTTKEKISELKTKFAEKKSILDSFSERLKEYLTEVEKLKNNIKEKEEKLKSDSQHIKNLEIRISIAEESKRLIKSYILQTFQETLDLIGDMATDILASVPNMANSTIYFEGCKETKSGALKDEVNTIINMDGTNAVPIKSLSGGERTTIDLAVDLAVIDVIETKVGKGADFFVVDEPFDGLDSVCKENYLEILTKIDTNKKIIMVDHSSELKEMVSDVITVVKNGESSKIIQ